MLKATDPAFAAAWDDALEAAVDQLEAEARHRAIDGVEQPHFHQGKVCGTVRKYSDALLMFLLRAHRPETYRDRTEPVPELRMTIDWPKKSPTPTPTLRSGLRASIRKMRPSARKKMMEALSNRDAATLLFDWEIWAREKQLPPAGDWRVWLILAGRGFGKNPYGRGVGAVGH